MKKSELVVEQPTPASTQTTQTKTSISTSTPKNETGDWKTYSNSGLNFSENYPDGFQLKEDNTTSKLFAGTDGHF